MISSRRPLTQKLGETNQFLLDLTAKAIFHEEDVQNGQVADIVRAQHARLVFHVRMAGLREYRRRRNRGFVVDGVATGQAVAHKAVVRLRFDHVHHVLDAQLIGTAANVDVFTNDRQVVHDAAAVLIINARFAFHLAIATCVRSAK